MNARHTLIPAAIVVALLTLACGSSERAQRLRALRLEQVFDTSLAGVRLGDGVPLNLAVTVRWRIGDPDEFLRRFAGPDRFAETVFKPRSREVANRVANGYPSVDNVFTSDRERFVGEVKAALVKGLPSNGITIEDVTLSEVAFPKDFTDAMEQVALKERELDAIKQKSVLDVETARASERQAEAEGQVAIKKAELEGQVAEINAKTEDKRRQNMLAKAETDAQIGERNARAEAMRQKLLAEAEAGRKRELAKVEQEDRKALKDLDVERQKELDQLALEKEKAVAQICATNPTYASFLVNRELASKVQIAVLPVGTDSTFLGGLVQNAMGKGEARAH